MLDISAMFHADAFFPLFSSKRLEENGRGSLQTETQIVTCPGKNFLIPQCQDLL